MKTLASFLSAAVAVAAVAARVEQVTLDLERPKRAFALSITEQTDTTLRASLRASGAEFDPDGWTGLLWFGTEAGGVTLTNGAAAYGSMDWTVPASAVPTNGRYSVQILGVSGSTVEEWGIGALSVRLSPSAGSLPAEWLAGNPIWHAATNALELARGAATTQQLAEAVAPLAAYAAYWPPDATDAQFFSYVTNAAGGLDITAYNTTGGLDVDVPEYIHGRPVETLWSYSFASNSVSSVSGGGRLWGIGPKAFQRCYSLESINLPTVGYVGSMAFEVCTNLYTAALPGSGHVVGSAFLGCTRLDYVDLGAVTSILTKAFSNCTHLRSVWFSGNAPSVQASVYESIPANQVTNYVRTSTATGWGASLGGMPVARMGLYTDKLTAGRIVLGGVEKDAWAETDISGKVDAVSGLASNLWLTGETIVSDSYTNLWWRNVYSNGWHWLVAYTNTGGGQ